MPSKFTKKPRTKKYTKKTKAGQVASIAKQVTLSLKPKKAIRFNPPVATLFSTLIGDSFFNIWLTNIAAGDQKNQRNGNKIHVKDVEYDFSFSNDHTKTRIIRFMIVKTINMSGDTLDVTNYTDLYTGPNFSNRTPDAKAGDLTAAINRTVLRVYCDKHYKCPPNTQGTTEIRGRCPINLNVTYDNTGSTTALMSGKLWLICQSVEVANDAPIAANNHLYGQVQVNYRDA